MAAATTDSNGFASLRQPGRGPQIPVLRASLPSAERLLPYLRRIDFNRTYTNFGPLVQEFESRLAERFGLSAEQITSANSGTSALVAAILATAGRATPERPLALVPSYTFIATAAAVEQCGYRPLIADIDHGHWVLDPARQCLRRDLDRIGVVVPVAAYGRPLAQAPWLQFRRTTGIPVVIDAAACFDRLQPAADAIGPIPIALSFHATKCFGTGEGGAVLSSDSDCVARAARALNFGFAGSRDSQAASINGKLSEYHAAVGLAGLDDWPAKLSAFAAVAAEYRRQFSSSGLEQGLFAMPEVSASYVLYLAADRAGATRIRRALATWGVDYRHWYGRGLHRQSHLRGAQRDSLVTTRDVAPRLLGLPCAVDLDSEAIGRVSGAIAAALTDR